MARLTPEQNFTGELSRLLADVPWRRVIEAGQISTRLRSVAVPNLGMVTLRQSSDLRGDLTPWENSIEVVGTGGRSEKIHVWDRDEKGMQNSKEVWQLLRTVDQIDSGRFGETG